MEYRNARVAEGYQYKGHRFVRFGKSVVTHMRLWRCAECRLQVNAPRGGSIEITLDEEQVTECPISVIRDTLVK